MAREPGSIEDFRVLAEAIPHFVWIALPDGTIDYYNRRWLDYTGLTVEDTGKPDRAGTANVVHPDDFERTWNAWARSIREGEPYEIEYRLRSQADGSYRWFLARCIPVRDAAGKIVQWIGTCTDIEEHKQAARRLDFMAKASQRIFESLDLSETFERLVELIVAELADWVAIDLIEADDKLRTVAVRHRDPQKHEILEHLRGVRTMQAKAEQQAIRALREHRSHLFGGKHEIDYSRARPAFAPVLSRVGLRSGITVPLFARDQTFGALVAYRFEDQRDFTQDDLLIFEELGRRASIAIDNAHSFQRERRVAATLQRALLPARLPEVPGWRVNVTYFPGATDAEIGGDWYDAIPLADGRVAFTVGDVTGRGLKAAVIMGKIRQALGIVMLYEDDPAKVLDVAENVLLTRHPDAIVTAFVAIFDPAREIIRYANAGHPYPLLRKHNGEIEELFASGLPLGLRRLGKPGPSLERTLEGVDMLVFYTDGLTEATRDLTEGLERVYRVLRSDAISHVSDPARMIAQACLVNGAHDDVAILTASQSNAQSWSFDAENAASAQHARQELARYLEETCGDAIDVRASEAIFGELVSNVVQHAPGPIDVALELRGGSPVLHVIDRGPAFAIEAALPGDTYAETGRGLFLISTLAGRVTIENVPGYGNHIAVELPRAEPRP